MYIELNSIFWGAIGILSTVALVFLIITLNNIYKLTKNINIIVEKNSDNINSVCEKLPNITENIDNVIINAKDISEVATEVTADALVAKDNLTNHYETIKDLLDIVINVFVKK